MELLINPTAKLVAEDSVKGSELDDTIKKLNDSLQTVRDNSIKKEEFTKEDKYVFHSTNYILNYLVHNKSFILIALGVDGAKLLYKGLNKDLDSDVIIMFNKAKIIIKE